LATSTRLLQCRTPPAPAPPIDPGKTKLPNRIPQTGIGSRQLWHDPAQRVARAKG
jgi:hypothetical protein